MNDIEKNPYEELGVSSTKKGVHEATKNLSKGLYPGAFCKVVPLIGNIPQEVKARYVQIIHSDGVGTKSNVAYIARQEGYGTEVYRTLPQDALVMNTDDMACVGVTNDIYVSNHIARNAKRVSDEDVATIIKGYSDFFCVAESLGINIYDAGGETADVGSYTTTLGIDVTATAIIEKEKVIDCSNIRSGHYIVGLASYGMSDYEKKYNSGIRSNGLTLAINSLLSPYYRKHPEAMDQTVDPNRLFTGKYKLDDVIKGETITVVESILSPTRTYIPVLKKCFEQGIEISGIIHCSGGGMTKSMNFGKNIRYMKSDLLPTPAIFREIQEARNIEDEYMYSTFNMGIGMEIIVPSIDAAMKVVNHARSFNIEAQVIGYTEATFGNTNEVEIKTDNKVLRYSKDMKKQSFI